jgi:hypothetical protein
VVRISVAAANGRTVNILNKNKLNFCTLKILNNLAK